MPRRCGPSWPILTACGKFTSWRIAWEILWCAITWRIMRPITRGRIDPRIKRFVMLGPPNHGSELADTLGGNVIFDTTLGASAQQLAHRWQELEPHLATPPCEFGIVAGGKGNDFGFNPLLPGDDDGTVRVAETRLVGASDFTLVDSLHSSLMANAIVQERTQRFLRTGCFDEQGKRHPIRERVAPGRGCDRLGVCRNATSLRDQAHCVPKVPYMESNMARSAMIVNRSRICTSPSRMRNSAGTDALFTPRM